MTARDAPSLRVLADITHPSLSMLFGRIGQELVRRGHHVVFASRGKDETERLLDAMGLEHRSFSREFHLGMLGLGLELLIRTLRLVRAIRRHRVDAVLSRNPAGGIAARLAGASSFFDTDDGRAAGVHHWLAAPFAHVITSPTSLRDDFGDRHVRYESLKSLAYLHPAREGSSRLAESDIRAALGIFDERPIFVLRRSAYGAAHDLRKGGVDDDLARAIIARLSAVGHVVISSERAHDGELATSRALALDPALLHDVLAAAVLVVTDGASVAEEAVVLGTRAVFLSDYVGERDYLDMLERRYGNPSSFPTEGYRDAMAAIEGALSDLPAADRLAGEARDRILRDHVDLVQWYADLVEDVCGSRTR